MPRLRLTLRNRIYFSMLAVILVAFAATGITALTNYRVQNREYHESRLHRKEEAVDRSLDYFLEQKGGHISQDSIVIAFQDKICELSDVHNLLINLYDLRGNLLISSNREEMDSIGIAMEVDYTILKQLSTGNNRAVIEKGDEGSYYLMAFWYFRGSNSVPIAIVSVPYFDTEEINPQELRDFLYGLGRVYIALFIITGLLAYFLANYITKSLHAIADSLRRVDIRRKNDPIVWKANDEIGALVHEYNRMLSELENSLEKLAKSERESAWREMARQVAHEIKNPLTPMKLRIQHLQRAWEDNSPEFGGKLQKTSEAIIEQIEALSHIAGEFSRFAQLPKPEREKVDLLAILKTSVDLFAASPGIRFEWNVNLDSALVNIDKDQALRIFNNLINNAIQAIPPEREGLVRLSVEPGADRVWRVVISDNGSGISEDQRSRIFTPNFTTKSTGTGLGLAMVKAMTEQNEGQVWFESLPGKGTSFFLEFPALS